MAWVYTMYHSSWRRSQSQQSRSKCNLIHQSQLKNTRLSLFLTMFQRADHDSFVRVGKYIYVMVILQTYLSLSSLFSLFFQFYYYSKLDICTVYLLSVLSTWILNCVFVLLLDILTLLIKARRKCITHCITNTTIKWAHYIKKDGAYYAILLCIDVDDHIFLFNKLHGVLCNEIIVMIWWGAGEHDDDDDGGEDEMSDAMWCTQFIIIQLLLVYWLSF